METLEIKKVDAVKAFENASKKGKDLLSDLFGEKTFQRDIMERIKTIPDVFAELGEDDLEVIQYRKLRKADVADYILNNQLAILIAKALNEGWTPDWNDSSEYKYFPWFKMGSSGSGFSYGDYVYWRADSLVGSRLCFKSSDLAKYAGTQFIGIYKEFMLIN